MRNATRAKFPKRFRNLFFFYSAAGASAAYEHFAPNSTPANCKILEVRTSADKYLMPEFGASAKVTADQLLASA
jgi:hypothetical protein